MSKLSKEEILEMVEKMADNDGVDIEELYSSAKEKLGESKGTSPRITSHDIVSQKFTKVIFAKVLALATAEQDLRDFANVAGVDYHLLDSYMNLRNDMLPTDDFLKKVATIAPNGVTFRQLKEATKGNINEARQSTGDAMTDHYIENGINSEHSLKNSTNKVTSAELEDFLADEDNKQNITKRVEAMTDAERDFLRDTEMSPMPKSYRHKENELVQTNFYGAEHNSAEDGAFGIPRALTAEGNARKQRIDIPNNVEKMDLFSGGKPRENIVDSEELKTIIEKLKALGIRDENYAKVKLGLMGYDEYLEGRPELTRFKRFKSVLKKAIGYKGVYSGTPGVSRIMTIESLFYKAYGNNNVWNIWFDGVNEPKRTGLNCQTTVSEYLDNAVRFILDYVTKEYNKIIHEIGVVTRDEILLTGLILGMLDYGYNARQILFALIRPTEAKRNWKMEPVSDYYKFNTAPDFYNEMCVRVVKSLHALTLREHNVELIELERLITEPTERMLSLTYESLMITNIDEVKQLMRKNRIISSVHAISNSLRYGIELEDEAKKIFIKNLESFVGYFSEAYKEECNDIMLAITNKDFTTFAESVERLIEENRIDKGHTHMMINNANKQMPDIKRRHEEEEKHDRPNNGEIGQICYNFQWGTPQY